ncbi:MAG TPA: UDP-2,3-diacylglucosamine diphosphatase [Steroidobacteraceae bacterium]|nr:UDP-2,3-diacylglucosamine diphosphatase [Steroidobacteraceae bacterium]
MQGRSRGSGRLRARTLFLSDIHLGFKRARVRELAEFLRRVDAECIVLVGDIVDALSLAKRFFWTDEHTEVLRLLLARRRAGARLVYLPGNHDASLSVVADILHGSLEVHREWVHKTTRGARLLVAHGDQFEASVACPGWLYKLGDVLYEANLALNHRINDLRRLIGRPYKSLAERLKLAVPTSARYIARFEHSAARYASAQGYDGVICGHIHRPNLCRIDNMLYANTGDWVESCSALVEDERGELQLYRWPCDGQGARCAEPALLADVA